MGPDNKTGNILGLRQSNGSPDSYRDDRIRRTQKFSRDGKIPMEGGLAILGSVATLITGILKLTKKQ